MVKQLLRETDQEAEEILSASQEKKYLRLGTDGKVYYITAAETMVEEVLAGPSRKLSIEEILADELNCRIRLANQLKERAGIVHQMMRDDSRRLSLYRDDYTILWYEYRDAIEDIIELDSRTVSQFRDKVAARIEELAVRINTMCDNWDPEGFDDFEQTLACYEKDYDLMAALQKVV